MKYSYISERVVAAVAKKLKVIAVAFLGLPLGERYHKRTRTGMSLQDVSTDSRLACASNRVSR